MPKPVVVSIEALVTSSDLREKFRYELPRRSGLKVGSVYRDKCEI